MYYQQSTDVDQDLVVAVDGGQSSTLALVATRAGKIIGVGQAGPSNHVTEPGGYERLERALHESTNAALVMAGATAHDVVHACLGLTGGPAIAETVAAAQLPRARIVVYKDVVTALAGASVLQPGVIVIAGTGAVAYGEALDGSRALADGWGYLMGDEGSAYAIGVAALRAASRASDGRGPATELLTRIPEHSGLPDLQAVHGAIYSMKMSRPQIAELAKAVAGAALSGDDVARSILHEAGQQLGTTALAVIDRLGRTQSGLPVYTTGGVFEAGEYVLAPFRAVLHTASPATTVHRPAFSPVIGALLMALRAADVAPDASVLAAITQTLPVEAVSKFNRNPPDREK